MPLTARQTSLAALWDTLISLPLAFAVFSGSNSSAIMEYPHFGIFISSPIVQFNSVMAIYMAFRIKTSLASSKVGNVPIVGRSFGREVCTFYRNIYFYIFFPKTYATNQNCQKGFCSWVELARDFF